MIFLHELREGMHRKIPVDKIAFHLTVDLIVAGLGSAGVYAAIAAAQEGVSVLGIERGHCSGGMSTAGAVNEYYYGGEGGLYEETDRICLELKACWRDFGRFHPDVKALALDRQLEKADVTVWYHAVIVGVWMEEHQVVGVRVWDGKDKKEIDCKALIDATSDGHIIRMCGVPTEMGRPGDGVTQPFSSVRIVYGKDGNLRRTNHDSGYIDPYCNKVLTSCILKAHSQHADSLTDEVFVCAASQIGIREGLRFSGRRYLTLQDVLEQKEQDALIVAYSDIDRHGKDLAFEDRLYQDWYMLSNLSTVAMKIPVPLGCMLPQGIDCLMTTGRCLSADCYAASAVRMNRDMYRLGEACGIAAALAISEGRQIWDVDRVVLKKRLLERGCYTSRCDWDMGFHFPSRPQDFTPVHWMENLSEILSGLNSTKPGVAFWSCRRLGKALVGDALYDATKSKENLLRRHAALALGIVGDRRALQGLRELIQDRSAFFFEDCRRTNQLRSANAICLVGRFGDIESLPELFQILSEEEYSKPMYHTFTVPSYRFSIEKDFNLVYFQHLSCAVAALIQIGCQNPEWRERIAAEMGVLRDLDYIRRITARSDDTAEYQTARRIWTYAETFCTEWSGTEENRSQCRADKRK